MAANNYELKVDLNDISEKIVSNDNFYDGDPYKQAWNYIDRNNIIGVMQSLTARLAKRRPDDPLSFILDQLNSPQCSVTTEKTWRKKSN